MKIAIGCLIQWYEADIVEEYFSSLSKAIQYAKDQDVDMQVVVDLKISTSTYLEQPVTEDTVDKCVQKIIECNKRYNLPEPVVVDNVKYLYSIGEYRHYFNAEMCTKVDVLVWGESDMLVPREMFTAIYNLYHQVGKSSPKWIATFASCKMWDSSWKHLEHPDFTDKPHSDLKTDWWSVNYDMNYQEMLDINNRVDLYEVRVFQNLKFNGCGLVISSDVIKAGVNVPLAAFFVHEDTAFMKILQKVFPGLPQFHFSDLLLVHNRKHVHKRNHIRGEKGTTVGQKRKSNPGYVQANQLSQFNVDNLFTTSTPFKTWKDVSKPSI